MKSEVPLEHSQTTLVGRMRGWITKPKTLLLCRVLVSVVLISMIVSRVDSTTVKTLFARTEPLYFGLVLLMLFADRFLMAYKWNLLLKVKGIRLSVWRSLRIYLIANFFGIFLPTGIGGDIYRIYYTSRREGQADDIAASVILERIVGTIASTLFAVFGFTFMMGMYSPQLLLERNAVMLVPGFLVFSLIAFWISMQHATLTASEYLLKRLGSKWFVHKWIECQRAYLGYRRYKRALLVFFLLSVIEQGFFSIANFWGAKALGLNIGIATFLGIIPICQIIMRLPISVNAIGVQEGLYALFFSRLGLSVSEAFSLALLVRIGHWLVVLPGGILYLAFRSEQRKFAEIPSRAVD